MTFKPEAGAKLRVLRWSRFVQGDIDAYMANVKKFTEATGVEVRVDNEGWEDVRPKAAVAANTGAGPSRANSSSTSSCAALSTLYCDDSIPPRSQSSVRRDRDGSAA